MNSISDKNTFKGYWLQFLLWWGGEAWVRVNDSDKVDNNLGPDRLEGPKALDPYHCRQITL